MAEDDDDAVFCAGKFCDDVADRELPFHGVGGKGVVFDLIAFEVVEDVAFELLVILAAHIARAEGGDLAGVLEGAFGIDVRERGVVGGRGFGRSWRAAADSDLGLQLAVASAVPLAQATVFARDDGQRQGQTNP